MKLLRLFLLCLVFISCTGSSSWRTNTYFPLSSNYITEIECLAQNIYFEARDQTIKGQIAVALVVINRVESLNFPNTICKVIQQASRYRDGRIKRNRCHFSWYCDGLPDFPKEKIAWGISLLISRAMLEQNGGANIRHFGKQWQMKDFLHGATHYHRIDVNPYWNRKMLKVMTIGDHIFWKDYLNE